MPARLGRGDLLPRIVAPPPGKRSLALSLELARHEAPAVNTLYRHAPAVVWREARGSNVVDVDGNRYIDLTSGFGVASIGHRHPRVVAALRRQSARLLHAMGDVAAHPARIELARRLAALAPVEDAAVYFAISGADAVEIALGSALLATGRSGIVAFEGAYHGTTFGALAVTSRPAFRAPFAAHLTPHVARLPFGAAPRAIAATLGGGDFGCAIVEPILGREGVVLPPEGWLASLARACKRYGVLLIADEIFTGFGKTGDWFVSRREGISPDLLCCGKALGGGLPIAAVVGRRDLFAAWDRGGEALHTATFLAHPLACAAALATLEVLERERLPARAARLGRRVATRLRRVSRSRPGLQVRGRGLLWGLELESAEEAARLVADARRAGLLLLAGGASGNLVQIAPPLSIHERQLEFALAELERLL